MISKRDLQLGKIALRAGMITKDQLKSGLALQKKLVKTKGKKVALGALLLKKGYLTEEQLQKIVDKHNERATASGDATASEVAEVAGASAVTEGSETAQAEEEAPKKKRRSSSARSASADEGDEASTATATKPRKDKSARVEAAPEEDPAERKRKSRELKRDKVGGSSRAEGGKNGATAEAEPRRAKKSSSPSNKTIDADEGSKKDSGKGKKEKEKGPDSEVDPAIFASAPEDAVDEEDRRLIACPECGKKFRVRKNQVGKRFGCRRCKSKVKVPSDLFEKPLEKARKKKAAGEVEVEEFSLGSGDTTGSDEAPAKDEARKDKDKKAEEEPRGSVRSAAARAAVAIERVSAEPSIRDLAKAAQQHQKKGLPPRTRFGVKQALTLVLSLATLVGLIGGGIYLKQQAAAAAEKEKQDRVDKEFLAWKKKVDDYLVGADDAKKKASIEIGTYRAELTSLIEKKADLVEGNNIARANAQLDEMGMAATLRGLLLAQADALLREGRPEESLELLKLAVKGSKDEALLITYGRTLIRARRHAEAAAVLEPLAGGSEAARALRGLALERGDSGAQAAKPYGELQDPLGKVLLARAHLVDRAADRAIEAVDGAGLDGVGLAAGKVVASLAHEQKGDASAAASALREAATAAPDSPFPQVALGELLLRQGKVQEAVAALTAANSIKGTARGFLALGDAFAAQLEVERARTFYRDASSQPLVPEGSPLVAGEVDPFEPPFASDPRALARCRLAALDRAAGDIPAAVSQFNEARLLDPFCPEFDAGYAELDLKDPLAGGRLQRALALVARVGGVEGETVRSSTGARVLLARAAWLVEQGQHPQVEALLGQVVAIDPALAPQAATLRGRSLEAMTQHSRAYDSYAEAARTEVQPTLPGGREYAAAARRFEERPDDAAEQARVLGGLEAALAHNPYHARAHLLRARVLVKQGKSKPALQDLERAVVLNKYLRDAYVTRGWLYVRDLPEREQTSETNNAAETDFETALKIEAKQGGEKAETHCGLALVNFLQNELLDAHRAADKCLELDPGFADGYRVRGMIRTRQGNAALARQDQKKYDELIKQRR